MINIRRRTLAAAVVAVAIGALGPSSVSAVPAAPGSRSQDQQPPAEEAVVHSWALAPAGASGDPDQPGNRPALSYELAPSGEVQDAVVLSNFSNVPLTFRLYATDAFNNDAGAFELLPRNEAPSDVGTWINLPASLVTVAPASAITVPFTMRVPANARPGDHAGAVLASSDALGTGPDGKTVTLDRRTGARVYVRVAGDLTPELRIEDVKTTYASSVNPFGGSATVRYRIVNTGNVRLSGRHAVSVAGPLGMARKRSPAQDLPELLPGEGLTVETSLERVPAAAVAFAEVTVEPSTTQGADPDLSPVKRSGIAFAPPITLVLLAVATWLAVRSARAYARHRREDVAVGVRAT